MIETQNLLVDLFRLAKGQGENFITTALAHLLGYAILHEEEAAKALVRTITGGQFILHEGHVDVSTQHQDKQNRYDLVLEGAQGMACVEAKVKSPVDAEQLRRYRQRIANGHKKGTLVLLTRYVEHVPDPACAPDVYVRWYQIAEQVQALLSSRAWSSQVGHCLADQFVGLLHHNDLLIEPVRADSTPVAATQGIKRMLREALFALRLAPRPTQNPAGYNVFGYEPAFKIYCTIENPLHVQAMIWNTPIPNGAVQAVGFGSLEAANYSTSGKVWVCAVSLIGEVEGFLNASAASQMEGVEKVVLRIVDAYHILTPTRGEPARPLH